MNMQRAIVIALLGVACATPVLADWDKQAEARDVAQRRAAQEAERKKQADMQRIRADAMAKAVAGYRQVLGKAAEGKSDAEVVRMMEQMGQSRVGKTQY